MLKAEYIVFCEEVQEGRIGPSLLRTFDALYALESDLPAQKKDFIAYIRIRSHGKKLVNADLNLRLVVEFEEQVMWERNLEFKNMTLDENHSFDLQIDFQDLVFKKYGTYYFKIEKDGSAQTVSTLLVSPPTEIIER